MSESEYKYTVRPTTEYFDTRHEAAGFAAVHGREYTYSPMNSIDGPIPLRVEAFEVADGGDDDGE